MLCPRCHRRYDNDTQLFCAFDGVELTDASRITLLRSTPCPETGQIIAERYRIVGFAGEGSMANVYLGVDTKTSEPVAMKTFRASGGPAERRRLFNEVLSNAAVKHPNVTGILDIVHDDSGVPYIIMEFLLGESFGDYLRRRRAVQVEEVLPMLIQAGRGLSAAHEVGIVHRDVKPDNLFLVGAIDESHITKMIDFGLAKSHVPLTSAGTAIGTVEFMAPEQTVSDTIDHRCDVYGFGIVLYRTFTGRLPFEGEDKQRIMAQHYLEAPAPVDETQLEDARVALVIAKAMRKRPSNRYQSMRELVEDLERLLETREGTLVAREPLVGADTFEPSSGFPRVAAKLFHETLGKPVPVGLLDAEK